MLKKHKFERRIKTSESNNNLQGNANQSKEMAKLNQSMNSNNSNLNTNASLIKLNRNEDDSLFQTERKVTNEEDIYDIEIKLDGDKQLSNREHSQFDRENYFTNRQMHKHVVDNTLMKYNKIQIEKEMKSKQIEIEEDKSSSDNNNVNINDNKENDKQKKKNKKIISKEEIVIILIVFFVLLSFTFISLFFVFSK
jgi:hypothetical protein